MDGEASRVISEFKQRYGKKNVEDAIRRTRDRSWHSEFSGELAYGWWKHDNEMLSQLAVAIYQKYANPLSDG